MGCASIVVRPSATRFLFVDVLTVIAYTKPAGPAAAVNGFAAQNTCSRATPDLSDYRNARYTRRPANARRELRCRLQCKHGIPAAYMAHRL